MSDASQGPGWWRAADDRWYPPEQHPDEAHRVRHAPPPPAMPAPTPAAAPAPVPTRDPWPAPPVEADAPGRSRLLMIVGITIVLALVATVGVVLLSGDDASAEPVALQSADDAGDDPFAAAVVVTEIDEFPTEIHPVGGTVDAETGVTRIVGTEDAVFGGLPDELLCDTEALTASLVADDARAATWAGVFGADAADIPDMVDGLTQVVLTADTWVTSHRYADGDAVPAQVVLQRSTSVLVDDEGVPAVNCRNGNPLLAPDLSGEFSLDDTEGEGWEGFTPAEVTAIDAGAKVATFLVVDVKTGDEFEQPAGGSVEAAGLEMATDGLGDRSFGDDRDDVVDAITELLGEPDKDQIRSYGAGCRTDTVWWATEDVSGDSLVLEFDRDDDTFVAYTVTNSGPDETPLLAIETPEGIRAGSPWQDALDAYPGGTQQGGARIAYLADEGYLFTQGTDADEDAYVEIIEAGAPSCAEPED